jgi:hypothetical protein
MKTGSAKEGKPYKEVQCTVMQLIDANVKCNRDWLKKSKYITHKEV